MRKVKESGLSGVIDLDSGPWPLIVTLKDARGLGPGFRAAG